MTIKLVVPMRTAEDWQMLERLNNWCMQHRVTLIYGENPGYVSLLFTGSSSAIYQLKTHFQRLFQQG